MMYFVILLTMKNKKMTNDHVTKCLIRSVKIIETEPFNTFPL